MGYWNDKSEEKKNEMWNRELRQFGISPDYRNLIKVPEYMTDNEKWAQEWAEEYRKEEMMSPENIPDNLALAYGKRAMMLPDKESVEEFTKWLQPWMAERGHVFEDYDSFKNVILRKSYGAMLDHSANKGADPCKNYTDYCKQIALKTSPKASIWKVGSIATENPLDILRLAVLTNRSSKYNNSTNSFLLDGTGESFWNHIQAGALAHDIVKDFLEGKGEGVLPEAELVAEAVEKNVRDALQGIEDGSIKGTEGTLWIKEGAYMALGELRGVFTGVYRDPDKHTPYNGSLELAIATTRVGAILREAGVAMDVEGDQKEKQKYPELPPERMLELKEEWLQSLKEKGYETQNAQTGQPYINQNEFESQYLFMDSHVVKTYHDFVMENKITPPEIPAFTDMVQEWCRENGSLLANEGTGKIEFREKMLTETLADVVKEIARANQNIDTTFIDGCGMFYADGLDELYNDKSYKCKGKSVREIFGAGGARFDHVFAEAVAKADSALLRHKTTMAYRLSEKDLLERLENRKSMWDNIHKNACTNKLFCEVLNILDDYTRSEETKQNEALDAIKRQVGEWKHDRPRMKILEKHNPGTIKECIYKALDLCGNYVNTGDLKERVDKAFSTNSVARQKAKDTRSR